MMVKFNERQRTLIAEKVCNAANLAIGALLFFGQFLSDVIFVRLAIIGLIVWLALILWAVDLLDRRHE